MAADMRVGTRVETMDESEFDWGWSLLEPGWASSWLLSVSGGRRLSLHMLTYAHKEMGKRHGGHWGRSRCPEDVFLEGAMGRQEQLLMARGGGDAANKTGPARRGELLSRRPHVIAKRIHSRIGAG